ncbi:HD domain-containing protein [Paraburkholderia elongata]|uniref:Phosphohydrolase n=1 Tax=Paraburkholderia elongata TaxID=2675747 RepID=A0A972NKW0_9BURK|nr:phosphohydrolase [Paraburkholderia elongata]NPT53672.1 phosphohydrolase [Paraburkholderia elongata]
MKPSRATSPDIVAGVPIPRSPMAVAAADAVRASLPDVLAGHAARVFVFASLTLERERLLCDRSALYVAAMFAGIGLSSAYDHSQLRYEVDSANAAREFLRRHGASAADMNDVWHAIALHMTPGIPAHISPLARVLAEAMRTDLLAENLNACTRTERDEILLAYPRESGFKERIIEAIGRGIAHRPASTFGTVCADVLERIDPEYCRVNFCGLILGAQWKD